jgi:CRP-like cAMP-binding protein
MPRARRRGDLPYDDDEQRDGSAQPALPPRRAARLSTSTLKANIMASVNIPPENRLLGLLPQAMAKIEPVTLKHGDIVYEPGVVHEHVYFPTTCALALFGVVKGRTGLGVGLVGPEGMVGVGLVLGSVMVATRILAQNPGVALRMRAVDLRDMLMEDPRQQWQFFRYAYVSMIQARQVAVCSNFHETVPRLVRWLLMTRDRAGACDFHLTQEYLAQMLGVRRASVTEAASALQRRNLISYSRGLIKILDRKRLESACCTCYQAIMRLERGGAAPLAQANIADSAAKAFSMQPRV